MNKIIFIIIFFTANTFAKVSKKTSETVIVLEEITSKGSVFIKNVVIIKDGSVMVNKEKLSPSEIITQSEHITKIAYFKESETSHQCASGVFKHILKKGKVLKVEEGCLDSERFKILKENFRALKKDRITE